MFKRKAYDKLLEWKRDYGGRYAALLEGPRRVGKSHPYEVDFLLAEGAKVAAVEVKSSNVRNHASIDAFAVKHSKVVSDAFSSRKRICREGENSS